MACWSKVGRRNARTVTTSRPGVALDSNAARGGVIVIVHRLGLTVKRPVPTNARTQFKGTPERDLGHRPGIALADKVARGVVTLPSVYDFCSRK